jgi:transposase-like protein
MPRKRSPQPAPADCTLAGFSCPNPECAAFNRRAAGNLSVAGRGGKGQAIRRLYCHTCGQRFSERQGTLLADTKLPVETVIRVVKCLAHGCSIEATADICEVDARSVQRLLGKAGPRADDFHRSQLDRIEQVAAVQLDELHGRVSPSPAKKGGPGPCRGLLDGVAVWVVRGCMRLWR